MAGLQFADVNRRIRQSGAIVFCALLVMAMSSQASFAQDAKIQEAKVIFGELNDSGIDGVASLVADGDQTIVSIRADGALGDHPTHIHQGSCADLDPNPQYPLTNVQLPPTGMTGTSDTEVDVPLQELLDTPHLILIHKSKADIGTYLACGDIVAGALTEEQKAASNIANPFPGTGAGMSSQGTVPRTTMWLLLTIATFLALSGVGLAHRATASARRTD